MKVNSFSLEVCFVEFKLGTIRSKLVEEIERVDSVRPQNGHGKPLSASPNPEAQCLETGEPTT